MPYVAMVGYSFEEYKLIASIILIDTYMKDILATYLIERYEYMGNNNNVIYFKTYDNKVILDFPFPLIIMNISTLFCILKLHLINLTT